MSGVRNNVKKGNSFALQINECLLLYKLSVAFSCEELLV